MKIFDMMGEYANQFVTVCHDKETGLRAFIVIQNTALGPALGGCRMRVYESGEEALKDALSLANDMTLRASISGCDLSGGSIVILGKSGNGKSEELFRVLGRFIDALEGKLIVTTELGTTNEDLAFINRETPYVVTLPAISDEAGDEALPTAWGVYFGIMACVREVFKVASLENLNVVVQGVGMIGSSLIELMKKKDPGVHLYISDTDYDKMKKIQDRHPEVKILSPEESLTRECHVLAPCAAGQIISAESAHQLRCKIIAGAARCLLTSDEAAEVIHTRGILLAPDFVINAGGVIQIERVVKELEEPVTSETFRRIALTLVRIFARAAEEGESPYKCALKAARSRIEKIARISTILAM